MVKVSSELEAAFTGNLVPRMFIKGPDGNTQLLSHIHLFMMEDGALPEEIDRDYINVEMIYANKVILQAEDASLVRTATPPIGGSLDRNEGVDFENVEDVGAPLARCSTPPVCGLEDDGQLTRTSTVGR